MSYEQDEYEKLLTVIRAARQNPVYKQDIRVEALGSSPGASVIIEAHVIEQFLQPPKSKR